MLPLTPIAGRPGAGPRLVGDALPVERGEQGREADGAGPPDDPGHQRWPLFDDEPVGLAGQYPERRQHDPLSLDPLDVVPISQGNWCGWRSPIAVRTTTEQKSTNGRQKSHDLRSNPKTVRDDVVTIHGRAGRRSFSTSLRSNVIVQTISSDRSGSTKRIDLPAEFHSIRSMSSSARLTHVVHSGACLRHRVGAVPASSTTGLLIPRAKPATSPTLTAPRQKRPCAIP